MAVIHFSAADVLADKMVEANIYPTRISKIDGPRKSASGKSISYTVDFEISDGAHRGKTITVMFNSEVKNPTLLGEMQFFPTRYFLTRIYAAIAGKDVEPTDHNLDVDELIDKPMDVAWGTSTVEGRLINVINSFHPRGYAASAPAF